MNRRPVLAGVVLITLGVVLLLDALGSLDASALLSTWWPVVVIVAGLVQLAARPRSVGGGSLLVATGGVLLLWRLEVVDDLSLLWPALLLTLGTWLLVGHGRRRHAIRVGGGEFGDEVDVVTIFNDRRVTLAPGPFVGGSIVTIFGDVDLDLTAGTPAPVARVDGVTVFGDVDLLVPADWRVTMTGPTLLGDVRIDERVGGPTDATTGRELRLELVTVFGDVHVRRAPVGAST